MNSNSMLRRELSAGKSVFSYTSGDSMQPLLYNQSTCVLIEPIVNELQKNDLPLYQRPSGQFVMHRIIKTDSAYYYTRGDNRTGLEKVPKEWAIGVVREITRKGRTIKVTDKNYLLYVHFWNFIYPIRRICYIIRRKIKNAKK